MTMSFVFLMLMTSYLLSPSHSLEINITTIGPDLQIEFQQQMVFSLYTSLGDLPTQRLSASPLLLAKHNFSNNCWFSQETDTSKIYNSIVIITDIPEWCRCTSEAAGIIPALIRLLQQFGATGVVLPQQETVFITFIIFFIIFFDNSFYVVS